MLLGLTPLLAFVHLVTMRGNTTYQLAPTAVVLSLAGLTWLVISVLNSSNPALSFFGRWPRYEGVPVLLCYVAALFIGAYFLQERDAVMWAALTHTLIGVNLLVLAFALLEWAGMRPLGGSTDDRMGSLVGNASEMGMLGAVTVGVLLPQAITRRHPLPWAGIAAATALVLLSGSRGAFLSLVVAVLVALFGCRTDLPRTRRWLRRNPLLTVTILALSAIVFVLSAVGQRIFATATAFGRLELWQDTVSLVLDHALLGVAPSGFVDSFPAYISTEHAATLGAEVIHDSPHNIYLQAASAGGIPLFLLLLGLTALYLVRSWRILREPFVSYRLAALVGTAAYGTALIFHFTGPKLTPLGALLLGAVFSTKRSNSTRNAPRVAVSALVGAVGAAVSVAATLGGLSDVQVRRAMDASESSASSSVSTKWEAAGSLRPWDCDFAVIAARYLSASALLNSDFASLALTWSDQAISCAPDSVDANEASAVSKALTGDIAGGVSTLTALIERAPALVSPRVERAALRYASGDQSGALEDLHEALGLDSDSTEARTLLERIGES